MELMELREMAEQVLYGTTLEEKLLCSPREVTDLQPGKAIVAPEAPGRPLELALSPKGVRAEFPGVNRLDKEPERAKMLHFLANHELLATELMALVLLRFPEAPKEFRMGVFHTLREEQAHTLMYMRRMRECGMHLGELPLNSYFWRVVAPMEEPIDFVTRLSLTFEQANLDFSKHYAKLFRAVGDTSTANLLEHIYKDEIEHVGHGLKWFRRWKEQGETDWQAFERKLIFPLSVSKAKGVAPYNTEGRQAAGLDDEFILKLEAYEKSRGRTPNIHCFNPNGEGHEAASRTNIHYEPKKKHKWIETDLDLLPLSWARKDDVVLVHEAPSLAHIMKLRNAGLVMPEWVVRGEEKELHQRKIGGVEPWMWSPDSRDLLESYQANISPNTQKPYLEASEQTIHSRENDLEFAERCGQTDSTWCETYIEVKQAIESYRSDKSITNNTSSTQAIMLKSPYSSAGRGLMQIRKASISKSQEGWIERILAEQGGVVVEPYFEKVFDFSAQYHRHSSGKIELIGMTRVMNDSKGRYLGCYVHPKWAKGLDKELSEFLFRQQNVMQIYRHEMVDHLENHLTSSSYVGAIGIDAMVHRVSCEDTESHLESKSKSKFKLRQVVELNMRITMGRVALELLRKSPPGKEGRYQILRKSALGQTIEEWLAMKNQGIDKPTLEKGWIALNDPSRANEFVAVWGVS